MSMLAEPPLLSTLSKHIASRPPSSDIDQSTYFLALQVQHHLRYQHDWTELSIVTHSPVTQQILPRPLIVGLPPRRIYVHPDDQAEEVKRRMKEEDAEVKREWVLPTRLREKWSLKRFAEVFDAVREEPPVAEGALDGKEDIGRTGMERKGRRGGKRMLLATLGEDSTVVYYIVHDGIVKPRQN